MANAEHVKVVKQGADAIRQWRQQHPRARLDLRGADLRGADLSRADLSGADLIGANLSGADLAQADLFRADLRGADLRVAHLREADLRVAHLRVADLREAHLREAHLAVADLFGANLSGADLAQATCGYTAFVNVDLSETKGLEAVRHLNPSTVGIDTIFRSKGRIPEVFLRGCGVPDEWIGYIQSMARKPIEYYTCFIAHSAQDQLFCDRLHNDLQAKGIRCWYFPADARGGRSLKEEIFDRGIRLYDKVMVVCSAHSLASEPVQKEIKEGWDKERATGRLVLFPVAIDGTVYRSDDLYPRLLRESRVIEDFRHWAHPAEYAKSLEKLVKDLAKDEPAPASPGGTLGSVTLS